jgi:hypothetical protein
MKKCGNCSLFRPSPYNSKTGNGTCKSMDDWLDKYRDRGTNLGPRAIEQEYLQLGVIFGTAAAICHPKSERSKCKKWELNHQETQKDCTRLTYRDADDIQSKT